MANLQDLHIHINLEGKTRCQVATFGYINHRRIPEEKVSTDKPPSSPPAPIQRHTGNVESKHSGFSWMF